MIEVSIELPEFVSVPSGLGSVCAAPSADLFSPHARSATGAETLTGTGRVPELL